jgi:hypothetical protein
MMSLLMSIVALYCTFVHISTPTTRMDKNVIRTPPWKFNLQQ